MAPTAAQSASARLDEAISSLATRQYGVISRAQLRALGLGDSGVTARASRGRLHRVHHGVYAVGHPVLGVRGRWMAALLAAGPGAVLSHAAAGALWELRGSEASIIDVTIPGSGSRRRSGIRIHRARSLDGARTVRDGIPVTTPERTILDLAAVLRRRPLERVLDQAAHSWLTDVPSLVAFARASAGHRGASRLLATLADHTPGTTMTKGKLEERFLALCRDAGLPRPLCNHHVEGLEADFAFVGHGLLVETDSWRHHSSREAFENDRRRDAIHAAAGYRTLRFTHRQIAEDPATVARAVRAVLDQTVVRPLPPHAR